MTWEIFMGFMPMVGALLVLAALMLFIMIKSPLHYGLKVLFIPLVLIIVLVSSTALDGMLGKARYQEVHELPESFFVLDYAVTVHDGEDMLEIWIMLKDGTTRLYMLDYNRKLHEELQNSKERSKKTGRQQQGKLEYSNDGSVIGIVIDDFNIKKKLNKN